MCTPLALAGVGAGQAIMGHMAANQQASARNRNRKRLYDRQVTQVQVRHFNDLAHWYHKHIDTEKKWAENALAANRAYQIEQEKLNTDIAETFLATQADYKEFAESTRVAKSLERSGRSAGRVGVAARGELGRRIATRFAATDIKRDRAKSIMRTVGQQRKIADSRAEAIIGFAPQRGMMPTKPQWDKGPGLMSLLVNTAVGAASGYMAGSSLQVAKAGALLTKGPLAGMSANQLMLSSQLTQGLKMDPNNRWTGADSYIYDYNPNPYSRSIG